MSTPVLRLALVAALAALASGAEGVDSPARSLAGMTKEQVRALGENEPVLLNGKTTTKAQVKIDLERGGAPVRASLEAQLREKLSAFELRRARAAQAQIDKARDLKAAALADVGRFAAVAVPTPTPATPQDPKLTSIGAAYVMPGSTFMVSGWALGAQAGTARLDWTAQGGGVDLIVEIWKPGFVVVTVPGGVSGVLRQNARFGLRRADGRVPSAMTVPFEPITEMKVLSGHDVAVVCSTGADLNACDPLPGKTLEGTHANTVDVAPDSGQDRFKVSLKNGWVVEGSDFVVGGWSLLPVKGYDAGMSAPAPGAATFDVAVGFHVEPFTALAYYGMVYIRGPVGTSHK